ncbi:hypothetical protein ACJX0J_026435, partial [Zea mays]
MIYGDLADAFVALENETNGFQHHFFIIKKLYSLRLYIISSLKNGQNKKMRVMEYKKKIVMEAKEGEKKRGTKGKIEQMKIMLMAKHYYFAHLAICFCIVNYLIGGSNRSMRSGSRSSIIEAKKYKKMLVTGVTVEDAGLAQAFQIGSRFSFLFQVKTCGHASNHHGFSLRVKFGLLHSLAQFEVQIFKCHKKGVNLFQMFMFFNQPDIVL